MKKHFLGCVLTGIMAVSMLSACGGNGGDSNGTKPGKADPFEGLASKAGQEVTVGVALNSVDDNTLVIKNYLNNEIGPALNMKFDFSEKIINDDQLVKFI